MGSILVILFGLLSINLSAADLPKHASDLRLSIFESCKDISLIPKESYIRYKNDWDNDISRCALQPQIIDPTSITDLNPLKEGAQYLSFSQKVASHVLSNLEKSQSYAECSALCFKGEPTCKEQDKIINCDDRKKEIQNSLTHYTKEIRKELALSNDSSGIINVNIYNAVSIDPEHFINNNLRDFEIGTPNPVGRNDLSKVEYAEALATVKKERQELEKEFKEKGYKNYNEWMAIKLMNRFDEHRTRYRSLIYEQAPIFSVIGKSPWSDADIAFAFTKLKENSIKTQKKVQWSVNHGKLEFSRANGEAMGRWALSLAPGKQEENDLLYYLGMKNQVEEVLSEDPSQCALAEKMFAHLQQKDMQNNAVILTANLVGGFALKGASSVGSSRFAVDGSESIVF